MIFYISYFIQRAFRYLFLRPLLFFWSLVDRSDGAIIVLIALILFMACVNWHYNPMFQ